MKIAIVDDMAEIRQQLAEILMSFANCHKITFEIDSFDNGEQFLAQFQAGSYSLVFMDIYMNGMDGTATARYMRKLDSQVLLIFLTSSTGHMGNAFSTHAFDYIQKPICTEKIHISLEDALRLLPQPDHYLTFTCENIEQHIVYSHIACLYANGHYTRGILTDGAQYRPYVSFSALSAPLSDDCRFLTVSRGVLCNMDEITDITAAGCTLSSGLTVPVTKRNVRQLQQSWRDYEFERIHRQQVERSKR